MKRLLYLLAIISMGALPLRASRTIGAVVQSADYDSAKGVTVVHVVNTSGKEITAVGLSIQVVQPDGSLSPRGYHGLDFLQGLIQGTGGIASGAMYDLPFQGQPGPVKAMVDTAVYSDGSADVLDETPNFQTIIDSRKGCLQAWQKINEVLNNALSDPDPNAKATEQLKSLLTRMEAQPQSVSSGAFILQLRDAILNASNNQSPDGLRTLIRMNSERISIAIHHVSLKAVPL